VKDGVAGFCAGGSLFRNECGEVGRWSDYGEVGSRANVARESAGVERSRKFEQAVGRCLVVGFG
jgi:hypothetical protein